MFSEQEMSKRIAEMVFITDIDVFIKWLKLIILDAKISVSDDEEILINRDKFSLGFDFNTDPITKGVMTASAISSPEI